MPRTLSANAITEIAKHYGTEPVSIVGVFWNGVTQLRYADKDTNGIPGQILAIGQLDEVIKVESGSSVSSVEITLDDSDGNLKHILDTNDIHKKKVIVYQYFEGMDLTDAFVVMVGEINTPIVWQESERKLTFTVISKIETEQVGFAPEEGQFSNISPQFIGKVWPLSFGQTVHVPATKVTEQVRGVTQSLIGIPDYTLIYKYWHLVERLQILNDGYNYYVRAIKFLNDIARTPNPIISDYVSAILTEDPKKQRREDLASFITENDKIVGQLKALLEDDTGLPKDITYAGIGSPTGNQGQGAPVSSTLTSLDQTVSDRTDVQNRINELEPLLLKSKNETRQLTIDLEQLDGIKKLLEIETDNAEYAEKNIRSIIKKIEKLIIDYVKTNHEIYKVKVIMSEHQKIPQKTVTVINGDKFPQNVNTRISINGLTYSGQFNGKEFTATTFEPRYVNIQIAERQDDQIDAFWIKDPNISLKGHYCITSVLIGPGDPEYVIQQSGYVIPSLVNRIFKVIDQIGTKCVIQLVELKPSRRIRKQQSDNPVLEDLTSDVWAALQYAQEHTIQERERILENAIEKYDKTELQNIKKTLEKLKDIVTEATTEDEVSAVNETIYRNVHEYNEKATQLRYSQESVEKAYELISQHEFKTLLKLCNLRLRLLEDQNYTPEEIPNTNIYFLTGFQINHIAASSPVMLPSWFQLSPEGQEFVVDKTIINLPDGNRIVADFLPDSSLWFAEPGSEVTLVEDESEKFVANILPSTIASVYGFKAINGIKQLIPIPSLYYTKNESDTSYLPLTCTTVTLKRPLKDYLGEDWEDGIYVSMTSLITSNTVDIISWLLSNYTNITADFTTFSDVRAKIDNFPSSFALFDKKDALALIEEICWQARCSAYVRNGIMYLKYLSEEPTSIETVGLSDIEFGTLSLEFTPTEDLVTKFKAEWLSDYSQRNKKNQMILRYNIPKYGEIEKVHDFYIYNHESLVNKSATFWLIRLANIWKLAKFRTPLTKLKVDTLDCITLQLTDFATSDVKSIVQKATYDSANHSIEFQCWLPVRIGEMSPYNFAWPANIDTTTLYPSIDEINAGYAGSSHSSVPKNIAYKILPNDNLVERLTLRPKDYGEAFPADANFIAIPNPLAGLDAADYITVKPTAYQTPETPRTSEEDTKPTYGTPVGSQTAGANNPGAIVGRITGVVSRPAGKFTIKDAQQNSYVVHQLGDSELDVDDYVTAIFENASNRYVTNEKESSFTDIKTFVVRETKDDYLVCTNFKYDRNEPTDHDMTRGDDETVTVNVAKPRLLQKTPFHNKTIEYHDATVTYNYNLGVNGRQASAPNEDTEKQYINPPYFKGDIIVARKDNTGYEDVNYIDMNEGGREWAWAPDS